MKTAPGVSRNYVRIEGIHCPHCVDLLQRALSALEGVESARITRNIACLTGPALPEAEEIVRTVNDLGYETRAEWISTDRRELGSGIRWGELLLIAAAILAVAWGLNALLGYNVFNAIPVIDETLSAPMLFVTGLLTSLHCVSMCGAIGFSVSAESNDRRSLRRPLLYNAGRVLSYTVLGGVAWAFGSVLSVSPAFRGVIILAAGLLMLLMALSMLGILPFSLPTLSRFRFGKGSFGPLAVGLLDGLMPCGPLQSMQLYALSTESFLQGALAMLLFALGTVPLMLAGGAAMNLLRGKSRRWVNQAASVLVLILAVSMLWRGALSFGVDGTRLLARQEDAGLVAVPAGEVQTVRFALDYDHYEDVTVLQGVPVRMVIVAEEEKLTGCNNEVVCPALGFDKKLEPGENVIEFTPGEVGEYTYTCWMNMLHNTIRVTDDPALFEGGAL